MAVIVAVVVFVTALVAMINDCDVEPELTVMVDGTAATAVSLLVGATLILEVGALLTGCGWLSCWCRLRLTSAKASPTRGSVQGA